MIYFNKLIDFISIVKREKVVDNYDNGSNKLNNDEVIDIILKLLTFLNYLCIINIGNE